MLAVRFHDRKSRAFMECVGLPTLCIQILTATGFTRRHVDVFGADGAISANLYGDEIHITKIDQGEEMLKQPPHPVWETSVIPLRWCACRNGLQLTICGSLRAIVEGPLFSA